MSTDRTNEIEEMASDWLVRRESGQWTDTDQAHFEQWLDASTLNRVAYLRLELAWNDSARLKALGAGISGDRPPPPGGWNLTPFFDAQRNASEHHVPALGVVPDTPDSGSVPRVATERHRSRYSRRRFAIAASFLAAIVGAYGALQFWGDTRDRYITPIGGFASVPMLDGSKITLNTNSEVVIALTQVERHVDLKQGEAFFEVEKDTSRPFVVEAGRKRVVAVGTKFSVRRDEGTIEVVVTEGKVRIEDAARRPLHRSAVQVPASPTPEHPDGPVFLTPGAIARANESGVLVQQKSVPDAETRLSWRIGVLTFRDQSLADAVTEFNRYNVRRIVIADPAVGALRIEGNFRATNVNAFVRLLESGFPVRATFGQDQIVLSSR